MPIHANRKRTQKRKFSSLFEIFSLICSDCSLIFSAFAFAWCEWALNCLSPGDGCVDGWVRAGRRCYLPVTDHISTWLTARLRCLSLESDLVSLNTAQEQVIVDRLMKVDFFIIRALKTFKAIFNSSSQLIIFVKMVVIAPMCRKLPFKVFKTGKNWYHVFNETIGPRLMPVMQLFH